MSPEESEMSGAWEDEAAEPVPDYPEFWRLARVVVRNATARLRLPPSISHEDVYQSLMLKLLPFIRSGRLSEVGNVSGWLYTAASHEARRLIQKESKRSNVIADEPPDFATPSRLMDASQIECGLLLREVEESLNAEERQLLGCMRHQYTSLQIATQLNTTPEVARKRVQRLKGKIREQLFPEGGARHAR